MKKFLKALFLRGLLLVPAVALAACDRINIESPPELKDKQIVCTLSGEAYIFQSTNIPHSVRSIESDVLCAPMKKVGAN